MSRRWTRLAEILGVNAIPVVGVLAGDWSSSTALASTGSERDRVLWTLAEWPVSRVNQRADYILGRVMLVHLTIIVGVVVAGWLDCPAAFFGFFVGCKVLSDLGALLPRVDGGTPGAPPRWLSRINRRFPRQNGETFDEYRRRTNLLAQPGARPAPGPTWALKRRKKR